MLSYAWIGQKDLCNTLDIRVVATSEEEATFALHDLQRAMAPHRLFLSSDKTHIIRVGTDKFKALMDVEDDKIISEAEEVITSGDCGKIASTIKLLFERLEFHSTPQGDERKFRAFANRLLDAGDFPELADRVHPRLTAFVIPRLRSHPERSDYRAKILSARPCQEVVDVLRDLLVESPSIFDWQRFHLWRLALYCQKPLPNEILEKAVSESNTKVSEPVAAQAILCVGKHGDNPDRQALFKHFTPQRSYPVQRAVLIAMQELPMESRDYFYKRALKVNSDHRELVEYLSNLEGPHYGEKYRSHRKCREEPLEVEAKLLQGVGLIRGEKVHFRLSRDDVEY